MVARVRESHGEWAFNCDRRTRVLLENDGQLLRYMCEIVQANTRNSQPGRKLSHSFMHLMDDMVILQVQCTGN